MQLGSSIRLIGTHTPFLKINYIISWLEFYIPIESRIADFWLGTLQRYLKTNGYW